jgi:hypothetical protein
MTDFSHSMSPRGVALGAIHTRKGLGRVLINAQIAGGYAYIALTFMATYFYANCASVFGAMRVPSA